MFKAIVVVLLGLSTLPSSSMADDRQAGVTTRYWDCCKASCAWAGKASVHSPVKTCAKDGVSKVDVNAQSGCNGGGAYVCNDQQPWAVNDNLAYGFAAATIAVSSVPLPRGGIACVCLVCRVKEKETGAVRATR